MRYLKNLLGLLPRRRTASVLAKQKPKHNNWTIHRIKKFSLFFAIITASIFLTQSMTHSPISRNISKIHFIDHDKRLSKEAKQRLTKSILHNFKNSYQNSLEDIGQQLNLFLPSEKITIIRPTDESLVVQVKRLEPIMTYKQTGKLLFISRAGRIFENPTIGNTVDLTEFKGIPIERLSFRKSFGTIKDPKYRHILEEGITLRSNLVDENVVAQEIAYEEFRGFTFRTSNNIQVYIGRSPFEDRIKRFKETMSRLLSRGIRPSQIELDYQGKAFIKEESTSS